jgi:hypothetical protein
MAISHASKPCPSRVEPLLESALSLLEFPAVPRAGKLFRAGVSPTQHDESPQAHQPILNNSFFWRRRFGFAKFPRFAQSAVVLAGGLRWRLACS